MKPSRSAAVLGPLPRAYQRLRAQLGQCGWLSQGSVVARPLLRRRRGRLVRQGPYYLWTCKVKGKTRCLALSQAQYELLREAIANHRRVKRALAQMETMTLQTILKQVPGVKRRK